MKKNAFQPFYLLTAFFLAADFSSCSLKYDSGTTQSEDTAPEFLFTNAKYTTCEDGKIASVLTAQTLERYKDGKATYGKNVTFQTFDKDEKIESDGKCGLLSSISKDDTYTLYDDIEINNKKEDITITADILKWNNNTEQLTSDRNDQITIKKGKTMIQGSGFSASGISKKYSFTGVVSGVAETDSESFESENNEAESNE